MFLLSRVIALLSVKYSGGVETDVFESHHNLGGARRIASQPVAKKKIDPGTVHDNAAGEATKKRPVFG